MNKITRALARVKAWAIPPSGPGGTFPPTGAVHSRGETRAAKRRDQREALSGWRQAHAASTPFRARIVAAIEKAKRLRLDAERASV